MNLAKINYISSLFLGVIAALASMVFQVLVSSFFYGQDAELTLRSGGLFIIAVFSAIEEITKYIVIFQSYLQIRKNIARVDPEKIEGKLSLEQTESEWKNTMVQKLAFRSSLLIGLGFAMTESGLALLNRETGSQELYAGIWGIFIIHIITSGIMGYYITNRNTLFQILIVICVFSLHLLYNSLVIMNFGYSMIYAYFIILTGAFALSCRITKRY
jgi:RsiW-degrading membrane proteinase PrsW (M82 family)